MYSKFLFLVIIIFEAEACLPKFVTFNIRTKQKNTLTCDHSDDKKQQNKYTALEGETFTIITKYEHTINHVICDAYTPSNFSFIDNNTSMKFFVTFMVEKRMGTIWNCTVLTHRNNSVMKPVVYYNSADYAAAYCFMRIHVRQKEPPQTILVNKMLVRSLRKDLLEKDVDFIAEYQYVDGDVVNVTCANFLTETQLTMEYKMAGTTSDKSIMKDITSSKMIGFVTKLHSGHNNSYMICTSTELTDYTKVMLRFVMRTKPNIISVAINGMILRPILTVAKKNHYNVEYKFAINQLITVMCEVEQTDVKLVVSDDDLDKSISENTELIPNKKTEIRFYLKAGDTNKSLACAADYVTGGQAESVHIQFTTADFPIEICKTYDCTVSTTLEHLTRENVYSPLIFYLKEIHALELPSTTKDTVFKETRVILRDRGLTTEPSTTTLSTAFLTDIIYNTAAATPPSKTSEDSGDNSTRVYSMSAVGVVTMIMLLVVLSYMCIKKQCCARPSAPIPVPKIDPASVFYENVLSLSAPINEREAAEVVAAAEPTSAEEHYYEEIH